METPPVLGVTPKGEGGGPVARGAGPLVSSSLKVSPKPPPCRGPDPPPQGRVPELLGLVLLVLVVLTGPGKGTRGAGVPWDNGGAVGEPLSFPYPTSIPACRRETKAPKICRGNPGQDPPRSKGAVIGVPPPRHGGTGFLSRSPRELALGWGSPPCSGPWGWGRCSWSGFPACRWLAGGTAGNFPGRRPPRRPNTAPGPGAG